MPRGCASGAKDTKSVIKDNLLKQFTSSKYACFVNCGIICCVWTDLVDVVEFVSPLQDQFPALLKTALGTRVWTVGLFAGSLLQIASALLKHNTTRCQTISHTTYRFRVKARVNWDPIITGGMFSLYRCQRDQVKELGSSTHLMSKQSNRLLSLSTHKCCVTLHFVGIESLSSQGNQGLSGFIAPTVLSNAS